MSIVKVITGPLTVTNPTQINIFVTGANAITVNSLDSQSDTFSLGTGLSFNDYAETGTLSGYAIDATGSEARVTYKV